MMGAKRQAVAQMDAMLGTDDHETDSPVGCLAKVGPWSRMPTILRIGPYRLAFYSSNGSEPAHVHVISATGQAKFWLEPLCLARSTAVTPRELRQIESIVSDNRLQLLRSWHEYFDR
jgi:hypothetical protein